MIKCLKDTGFRWIKNHRTPVRLSSTSIILHCRFCSMLWFYYLGIKSAGGLVRGAHRATQYTAEPLAIIQKTHP